MDNIHTSWTLSMKKQKKKFCPWTSIVHGQLSMKRTRPQIFLQKLVCFSRFKDIQSLVSSTS
jgi:hypothetical protein